MTCKATGLISLFVQYFCSSKRRCRSKTHHSGHRVLLTTERKGLCCKVHSKDIAHHIRQLRRSLFISRSGRGVHRRVPQEELSGCRRCWQECALREGFHAFRKSCLLSSFLHFTATFVFLQRVSLGEAKYVGMGRHLIEKLILDYVAEII